MKKSISTWSFYGDWNLEEKMIMARDAGFTGFEPEFTEDGDLGMNGDVDSWSAAIKFESMQRESPMHILSL